MWYYDSENFATDTMIFVRFRSICSAGYFQYVGANRIRQVG